MSLSADVSVCGDDESNLEVASYLYDRAWSLYLACYYERARGLFEEVCIIRDQILGTAHEGALEAKVTKPYRRNCLVYCV